MCILTNDRLTNRLSVSLCVNCTLRTGPISLNIFASAGFSGSAPVAIGGGSVADLFSERDRATAMALYNFGPLLGMLYCHALCSVVFWKQTIFLGPALGPVAGGYIAEKLGIKWVFIVLAGLPTTSSTPRSTNIFGLSSCFRSCKHRRDSFLEGNLRTYHPIETCSAISRPRSHQSRCNPFTWKQISYVVDSSLTPVGPLDPESRLFHVESLYGFVSLIFYFSHKADYLHFTFYCFL